MNYENQNTTSLNCQDVNDNDSTQVHDNYLSNQTGERTRPDKTVLCTKRTMLLFYS